MSLISGSNLWLFGRMIVLSHKHAPHHMFSTLPSLLELGFCLLHAIGVGHFTFKEDTLPLLKHNHMNFLSTKVWIYTFCRQELTLQHTTCITLQAKIPWFIIIFTPMTWLDLVRGLSCLQTMMSPTMMFAGCVGSKRIQQEEISAWGGKGGGWLPLMQPLQVLLGGIWEALICPNVFCNNGPWARWAHRLCKRCYGPKPVY